MQPRKDTIIHTKQKKQRKFYGRLIETAERQIFHVLCAERTLTNGPGLTSHHLPAGNKSRGTALLISDLTPWMVLHPPLRLSLPQPIHVLV
jgi:hypothetical protein